MFVWRRRAGVSWLAANESRLRQIGGDRLVIIAQTGRKQLIAEIAETRHRKLEDIRAKFGGRIETFPRDLASRFAREQNRSEIKIGKRLTIVRSCRRHPASGQEHELLIPAGAAFGTGEHPTTAMCLRFLEEISRNHGNRWMMLDLGTGSGILALAAGKFGARKVVAIDSDPRAISTARDNAQSNKLPEVKFQVATARRFRSAQKFNIITANLFSELLIELLPRIKRMLNPDGRAILSGVLRWQETDLTDAAAAANLRVVTVRRRGKWIAMLVNHSGCKPHPDRR